MSRSQLESWSTPDNADTPMAADPSNSPSTPDPTPEDATTAITLSAQPVAARPSLRPWRKRLMWGAGVVALGGVGYGLWAWLLRPPLRPYVLDLSPAASQYAITDQQNPLLNWQISHPRQVESIVLRTLTADGALVGEPQTYDLSGSLPVELLAYCSQTGQRLTCQNVPTQVRQPGQYRFEITLLPKIDLNLPPVQATSSLVTITDRPMPLALELLPRQMIYSEAGTVVSANQPTLPPPVTGQGVELSWVITHPEMVQGLLVVVRKPGGIPLGGLRFSLRDPENPTQVALPEELQPFCQLGDQLVCQGVPTGVTEVGQYQFELTPIPVGLQDTETPVTKTSEVVEILPRPMGITAFRVDGQEAQPKYLIPVEPGRPIGFQLDWLVEGGATTQVELLPSPGTVGRAGSVRLPLPPSGTTTITLRVSDGQNPPIVRAVTFETFNPNPNPPIVINPERPQAAPRPSQPAPSGQTPPAAPQPGPSTPSAPRPQDLPASPTLPNATPPNSLPEDLRNRTPEDLNLSF